MQLVAAFSSGRLLRHVKYLKHPTQHVSNTIISIQRSWALQNTITAAKQTFESDLINDT